MPGIFLYENTTGPVTRLKLSPEGLHLLAGSASRSEIWSTAVTPEQEPLLVFDDGGPSGGTLDIGFAGRHSWIKDRKPHLWIRVSQISLQDLPNLPEEVIGLWYIETNSLLAATEANLYLLTKRLGQDVWDQRPLLKDEEVPGQIVNVAANAGLVVLQSRRVGQEDNHIVFTTVGPRPYQPMFRRQTGTLAGLVGLSLNSRDTAIASVLFTGSSSMFLHDPLKEGHLVAYHRLGNMEIRTAVAVQGPWVAAAFEDNYDLVLYNVTTKKSHGVEIHEKVTALAIGSKDRSDTVRLYMASASGIRIEDVCT